MASPPAGWAARAASPVRCTARSPTNTAARSGGRARACPPRGGRRRARRGRGDADVGRLVRRRRTARRPGRTDRPPGPRRGRARRRRGDHAHRTGAGPQTARARRRSTPNASPISRSTCGRATPSATSPPWDGWRRSDVRYRPETGSRFAARPIAAGGTSTGDVARMAARLSRAEPRRLPGAWCWWHLTRTTRHSASARRRPPFGRAASTSRWCR